MDIELEPWYTMDENGKMHGIGIYGEDLETCTPKRYKVAVKHLRATIPNNGVRQRRIPSWENLNYMIFMCKYTHHYGLAIDLYCTITKSKMPQNEDEEKRLDIALEAAELYLDWEE